MSCVLFVYGTLLRESYGTYLVQRRPRRLLCSAWPGSTHRVVIPAWSSRLATPIRVNGDVYDLGEGNHHARRPGRVRRGPIAVARRTSNAGSAKPTTKDGTPVPVWINWIAAMWRKATYCLRTLYEELRCRRSRRFPRVPVQDKMAPRLRGARQGSGGGVSVHLLFARVTVPSGFPRGRARPAPTVDPQGCVV